MKKYLVIVLLTVSSIMRAEMLLDGKFSEFIKKVVNQEDQKDFANYYNKLVFNQNEMKLSHKEQDKEKVRKKIADLQEHGKISLAVKNPHLAQKLKVQSVSKDPKVLERLNTACYRYGAYEEFLKNKAGKQKSILAKTQSYVRDVTGKVTSWFVNIRRSRAS